MAERTVLTLYKQLLREGSKFCDYNFRSYAVRRVKDAFREYKDLKDAEKVRSLVEEGERSLQMLRRQVAISSMYKTSKLVVENNGK